MGSGFDCSARGLWRGGWERAAHYIEELPFYWRVPVVAWTFVIALPLIATWATLSGEFDAVGAVFVFLLWMLYVGLLRWHYRTKGQARAVSRRHRR